MKQQVNSAASDRKVNTTTYLFDFQDLDKTKRQVVGGKGASLGELKRIEGVSVPDGFCISTDAYKRIIGETSLLNELLDRLSVLSVEDRDRIRQLSGEIRTVIEGIAIPQDILDLITRHLSKRDDEDAYAIRSSATAEDMPTASFAGQHDTYLNIIEKDSILRHISKCWASLFTDRAVIYRIQNSIDHRKVHMSVVVQKMVFSHVSGIMFTADPLTSNRKVVSIDASLGLGEAMVSGLVNTDHYEVRDGRIIGNKIAVKKLAIHPSNGGGTKEQEIEAGNRNRQALKDAQILELERLARKIEAHFGCPQDIEWCLVDNAFYIVQSRPITTLYPVPESNDRENRVYVSVGHQQMMTDAMKPLGLSFFLLTTRAPMRKAGGRLFVDVTDLLASPDSRKRLLDGFGQSDPLIKDALSNLVERGDFIKLLPHDLDNGQKRVPAGLHVPTDPPANSPQVVSDLIKRSQASIEALKHNIQMKSGTDLFDFILDDFEKWKSILFDPQSLGVVMTAMNASSWINEKMKEWLGEINAADTLSQSVANNITSEMGLELLDVADVIRPYPDVIEYLQCVRDDSFLEDLLQFDGGQETRDALDAYLNKYGMRCVGEIDVTRTRWKEKPSTLLPLILSNIKNFEPGASKRKFEQGLRKALAKQHELLDRLKQLPDGEQNPDSYRVQETKRMIEQIRNFAGYREYPKYFIVSRYFIYKQALLKEAEKLVEANIIHDKKDIYYLSFEELHEVVRTHSLDCQIISERQDEYKVYDKLTPPRVITSDGEIITGKYNRENLRAGAIAGLPVSSGVIEGRARVILNMENADLEDGDILVTLFTDPSWTPLFVSIQGLVTEVGGLMTHGAVIAREYGLPAVVGVENATSLIKDGQRIRVNGTEGYIEILEHSDR